MVGLNSSDVVNEKSSMKSLGPSLTLQLGGRLKLMKFEGISAATIAMCQNNHDSKQHELPENNIELIQCSLDRKLLRANPAKAVKI